MISIVTPAPVAHAGLLGLGVFRPERIVTNDEICQKIDSSKGIFQDENKFKKIICNPLVL